MKNFYDDDFYDTQDLEEMSKENLIAVAGLLQSQLAEAQRIIRYSSMILSEYSACENIYGF